MAATRVSSSIKKRGSACASFSTAKPSPKLNAPSPGAWRTAAAPIIPPPLVDSPKCPGCSLVGICMPDETRRLQDGPADSAGEQLGLFDSARKIPKKSPARETRLLVAPRVDRRPLYLNSQGLRVGKSGGVLRIKERDKVVQEAQINEICQVNLMGNIQISTQAVQELCQAEKPICYFSQGGWFYGVTTGLNTKNVMLRRAQFRLAEENWFRRRIARKLVAGKIRNQRTLLLRNHIEPPKAELREMKRLVDALKSPTHSKNCSVSRDWRHASTSASSPAC